MDTGDVRENRMNLKRISELVDEIREALDKERGKTRNTDDGRRPSP